jgi:5-methylcytosine-specific restriction endonuclease McrA
MLLGQLRDGIEALNALDLDTLEDTELSGLVFDLQAETSLLAAAQARVLARWDARMVWADDGSKAAGARLARDAGMCRGRANAVLHRARKLATMPVVAAALAEGRLSIDLVDLLVAVNLPRRAALFARDEALLIKWCLDQQSERDVRQVLDRWAQAADEHLEHDPAKRERQGRYFNADRTLEGIFDLRGRLDRVDGTVFANEHARLEREMFLADWADARAEFGENCGVDKLARTPGQRRADALIEMAKRSATRPANGVTPSPLLSILVGYETFNGMICELADGTPLSRDHLLPLLAEADIERLVFDAASQVIDVSVRQRFFTGALRHAIEIRDRHCQFPGCDVPGDDCEVDHIVPYSQGGETKQSNGRLYCKPHNGRRTRRPYPNDIDDPAIYRPLIQKRLEALKTLRAPPDP